VLKHALKFCLLVAFAMSANATTLLFQLTIAGTGSAVAGGNFDAPILRIANVSTGGAATLTKFRITVGDTAFNWDRTYVNAFLGASTRTRVTPNDNTNGGLRSDVLEWNFTGLDVGERVDLGGELDADAAVGGESAANFRTVLWNNGTLTPNALVTVHFLSGGVTTIQNLTLPDQTTLANNGHTFVFGTPIPEPGTMATFAAGIAAIVISRFRRRS
jgi:hypothetical protein